jgi:glutamine amidotransferase
MIGIIDYGLGNLASVAGAVRKLGYEPIVTSDPSVLSDAEKLILPGVGAFGDGMKNLHDRGMVAPLTRLVCAERRPILGICLGFQLLAEESDEFGLHRGLAWIKARVRRISSCDATLRIPHVGWDEMRQMRDIPLFDGIDQSSLFYYVHSYVMESLAPEAVAGTCEYGEEFTAVLQSANIHGTQFHPEKSQQAGLKLLGNFLAGG